MNVLVALSWEKGKRIAAIWKIKKLPKDTTSLELHSSFSTMSYTYSYSKCASSSIPLKYKSPQLEISTSSIFELKWYQQIEYLFIYSAI